MPSGILCHLLPNIILPHRIWIQSSGVKAKLKISLLLLLRSFQVHLENWDRWKPLLKYQIKNRDYLTNLKTNLKSTNCSRDSCSMEDLQSSVHMVSGEVFILGFLKNGNYCGIVFHVYKYSNTDWRAGYNFNQFSSFTINPSEKIKFP